MLIIILEKWCEVIFDLELKLENKIIVKVMIVVKIN